MTRFTDAYHESGFLNNVQIELNRLFTPVKKIKCKRDMPKKSAITSSKPSKETQEEAVKQVESQQYRHQSDIIDIALLPSSLTLYVFHTPLYLPMSTPSRRMETCRYFLALEFKQNLRILAVKPISHSQTKFTYPKFSTKSSQSLRSHPLCSHLLILLLKSSRLFKIFISVAAIC